MIPNEVDSLETAAERLARLMEGKPNDHDFDLVRPGRGTIILRFALDPGAATRMLGLLADHWSEVDPTPTTPEPRRDSLHPEGL